MDIAAWLRQLGLEQYAQGFRQNAIDADLLPKLTADDLKELGVSSLGHRKKLLEAIAALPMPPGRRGPSFEVGPTAATREAERRQLTVMFCDLVGSTGLSTRLDPEDMGQVIRVYQDCCSKVVNQWDGHIAKFMGDGVLAYFGWPQAHEDDAERAIRAGLAIVEELAGLETPAGEPLAARVGIATGLVMVGEVIGEGGTQEETVVGETPNLAARLQALAEPRAVVIAPGTRRLIGGLFDLTDLGEVELKGFTERISAWQVAGESAAQSRFDALRGRQLTPFVGRQNELGILLERWAWAKEGDGQVVLLSGEAGIGKSRMVQALRERLAEKPHICLDHYGSPYHRNSVLYPVIVRLLGRPGLDGEQPPERRLAALEALFAPSADRLEEVVPLIAALLSIPTGERYPPLDLSPQRQKQRTLEALLDRLAVLAPVNRY